MRSPVGWVETRNPTLSFIIRFWDCWVALWFNRNLLLSAISILVTKYSGKINCIKAMGLNPLLPSLLEK